MPEAQGPGVKGLATTRRQLRQDLRRLRESAQLPQAEVAHSLDWSHSKLIRIENGSVGVSVTDVKALATLYHAPPEVVEDLVRRARKAKERPWWSGYRHVLNPQMPDFMGYEADATRIMAFQPTMVPALLQTRGYAEALLPAVNVVTRTAEEYQELVDVRMRRQDEILRRPTPPELLMVIDEAALRRVVGGVAVMRGQLDHIADLARNAATVSIGVLPFSAGPHVGMQGSFQILEFAVDPAGSVLFFESALGEMSEGKPDQCERFRQHLRQMHERSLTGRRAVDFVRRISKELS